MADLYGSSDVTIRNDDGTKIVDIDVTTANSKGLNVLPVAVTGDWYPKNLEEFNIGDINPIRVDPAGNLMCRAAVLTDEGGLYEPFAGDAIDTDTWTVVTGTGQSVAVANSICSIVGGTTADAEAYIQSAIDFAPVNLTCTFSISQRIANQDIYFGFADGDTPAADTMYSRFYFSGTDNTKVIIESASSVDTGGSQTQTVTLPYGLTTASSIIYRIEARGKQVDYFVGTNLDQLVRLATFPVQMPDPYTVMNMRIRVKNGASSPASSTTISTDTVQIANINILDADVRVTSGVINVNQNVLQSGGNNTTANLAAGATWTGAAETVLGISAIQLILKADQNCTVYIDQSSDGVNWDVTDTYNYKYSIGGDSRTLQAIGSYFRARITNVGSATTTYLRFSVRLCPVVESLPRSLDAEGLLRTSVNAINDPVAGTAVKIGVVGEIRTAEHTKLVGEDFEGTLDTNFWTSTLTGTGSATLTAGELVIATGATAASTALVRSVRVGRYVGGCTNYMRCVVRCPAITGTNTRRWGAFSTTDGFFFEYDGTTLKVVTRIASADTAVASGSFNGELGSTYAIGTSVATYEIVWSNSSVWFYVGDQLIHKVSQSTAMASGTLALPASLQNVNGAGNTNNNQLVARTITINRVGKQEHMPIYKNLAGAATTVCKYGPGVLHRICNNAGAGTATIYDNTAGSGTKIAVITFTNNLDHEYHCPFFTGLTIVTTGASQDSTAVYE